MAKRATKVGLLVGSILTGLRTVLGWIGEMQTVQGIVADRGLIVEALWQVLLSPWLGPVIVVVSLCVYFFAERNRRLSARDKRSEPQPSERDVKLRSLLKVGTDTYLGADLSPNQTTWTPTTWSDGVRQWTDEVLWTFRTHEGSKNDRKFFESPVNPETIPSMAGVNGRERAVLAERLRRLQQILGISDHLAFARPSRSEWRDVESRFEAISGELKADWVQLAGSGIVEWTVSPVGFQGDRRVERYLAEAKVAGQLIRRIPNVPTKFPVAAVALEDDWLNAVAGLVAARADELASIGNSFGRGESVSGEILNLVDASKVACAKLAAEYSEAD